MNFIKLSSINTKYTLADYFNERLAYNKSNEKWETTNTKHKTLIGIINNNNAPHISRRYIKSTQGTQQFNNDFYLTYKNYDKDIISIVTFDKVSTSFSPGTNKMIGYRKTQTNSDFILTINSAYCFVKIASSMIGFSFKNIIDNKNYIITNIFHNKKEIKISFIDKNRKVHNSNITILSYLLLPEHIINILNNEKQFEYNKQYYLTKEDKLISKKLKLVGAKREDVIIENHCNKKYIVINKNRKKEIIAL